MKVGAGKSEFDFPIDFFPTEGFTKVEGALNARVAILESGMRMAILSLEMTSLPDEEVSALKSILRDETGIDEENIWISVTHTFSAPHILPDFILHTNQERKRKLQLKQLVEAAVRCAAENAVSSIRDASLFMGKSLCDVNINRDFETPEGWWIGNSGKGPSDKTVTVIRADDCNDNPVLLLVHYAVQSSVMDGSQMHDGGKLVTSDLAGSACSQLEKMNPGCVAMFLPGAAGDQAPCFKARTTFIDDSGNLTETDIHEEAIPLCEKLGCQLAKYAIEASQAASLLMDTSIMIKKERLNLSGKHMSHDIHQLKPVHFYRYLPNGEKTTEIEMLCIGQVVLVGLRPELNCLTAKQIEGSSPNETTLVVTMVNGGQKYMADTDSYDRFTYEAMNSPFAQGSAEILRDCVIKMLSGRQ